MKYADLHIHTIYSDGTFTPEEVVTLASSKNLTCIAICDHDCVDAVGIALEPAANLSIEIVPGVELTVIKNGKEIHVLGYFIAWREQWLQKILRRVQAERNARIDKMIAKLKNFNIEIPKKKVLEIAGGKGSVGRLHLARALLEIGAISRIQEAFDKYIGDFKPCYVEDIGFSAVEAVSIIDRAGGVPVLAHPAILNDDGLVLELIGDGLRGIEVFHSDHPSKDSEKYQKIARENNLLMTGGSDCHGYAKRKILMGGVKVPYEFVEALKMAAGSAK